MRVEARIEDCAYVVGCRDGAPGFRPRCGGAVFEPLFTTKPKATGLGLAISRQIIDGHGGTMRVVDEGAGATLEIRLPRQSVC